MSEWRKIDTHPGYEISDDGRVRNIISGNVLHPWLNVGYPMVQLFGYGIPQKFLVHRLVALYFIGPPPEGKIQVNHKDGTRTNNHVSNLEWVTAAENMQHAHRTGAMRLPKSDKHWQGKKTHCKNGHEFTDANTYVWHDGTSTKRGCRTCRTIRVYESRERTRS